MTKKLNYTILIIVMLAFNQVNAQKTQPPVDTSIYDYDELFNELDAFLDSLMSPRSYTVINVGVGTGFFNYESKSGYALQAVEKVVFSPGVGFFHKTGMGVNAAASMVNDSKNLNPFQFSFSLSYDYLKSMKWIAGVSATHFFTKDSLSFYTSPLKNEIFGYISYRSWWIKPTLSASYGWGTRRDVEEREDHITSLRLKPRGYTRINTEESVSDFNLTASVRHDFYWLNVFSKRDYIRLTPQINFVSGTQKFGFNQVSNSYATIRYTNNNIWYSSENLYLDDHLYFQPLSLTGLLKTEISFHKFYVQPQLIFDYYFPVDDKNFTTTFRINAGLSF